MFGQVNSLGNIPVEIQLEGSCSNCEGLDLGIYDLPTSIDEARRQLSSSVVLDAQTSERMLQELCFCPANEVGERAPFEAEFIVSYQTAVEESSLDCIDGVADCFFGTNFGTGLIVSFDGSIEDVTLEVLASIEDAFLISANNEFENNDLECNPQFRVVETVEAAIVSEDVRRKLSSFASAARELQIDIVVPSPSPSIQPSVTSSPSVSLSPSLPAADVEIVTVDVFLFVTGVCNQCSNDLTISNQVSLQSCRVCEF